MYKIITLILLLVATDVSAEAIICQKDGVPDERNHLTMRQGDCLSLGICSGFNNTGIDANCIIASDDERTAFDQFTKIDFNVISGSRVISMTQQEQDDITDAEVAAVIQKAADRLTKIDDNIAINRSSMVLTKADNAIDNIGSLADAKVFLKKLVRYIVSIQ
jgi:hypothetical protein